VVAATDDDDEMLDPRPAHARVYSELRQRLLDGALAPGERVTLRGLGEALSVSMTPVREAVRRLAAERGLEVTPTGRVVVPTPRPERLDELFAARALLEPELARRALPGVDARLRGRLAEIDAALQAGLGGPASSDAPAEYIRANTRFHAVLYAAAGAPALLALVESGWLQTAPTMRCVYARLGSEALPDFHQAALGAIDARDAEALAEAIRSDVLQGARLVAPDRD